MFPETALVTGSASGIGAALVALLREQGAGVEELDLATGFDVSRAEDWERVGPVDAAFLNAGVTGEDYRRALAVNVDGVVLGVERLARVMRPGGAIVVTASLAGLVPMPADPVYTGTKHFVVGYVRAKAPALAGIRLNAVCPGMVDTPMLDGMREALAGFPLLAPRAVAEAALAAARAEESGAAWVVQPGREPVRFRFPNVPGPRGEGEGRVPPTPAP